MVIIRIESCATEAIARQRAGFWKQGGFTVEVFPSCTAMSAVGTPEGGETGNAPVFGNAAFVVLARKPAQARADLLS